MEDQNPSANMVKDLQVNTFYQVGDKSFLLAREGEAGITTFEQYINYSQNPGEYALEKRTEYALDSVQDMSNLLGTLKAAAENGILPVAANNSHLREKLAITAAAAPLPEQVMQKLQSVALPDQELVAGDNLNHVRGLLEKIPLGADKAATPSLSLAFAHQGRRNTLLAIIRDTSGEEKTYEFNHINRKWQGFNGDKADIKRFSFADAEELTRYIRLFKEKSNIVIETGQPLFDVMFDKARMPDEAFQQQRQAFRKSFPDNMNLYPQTSSRSVSKTMEKDSEPMERKRQIEVVAGSSTIFLGAMIAGSLILSSIANMGNANQKTHATESAQEKKPNWVERVVPLAAGTLVVGAAVFALSSGGNETHR